MTAIWRNDGRDWTLLSPSRFPDEATLHRLIEEAPHLLPLAGSPQLIVVGKEVRLGAGYADLHAKLRSESAGLVTIWNENGAYLQFWRSVFERCAPRTLKRLDECTEVRQGNSTRQFNADILEIVRDAYVEANQTSSQDRHPAEANGVLSQ